MCKPDLAPCHDDVWVIGGDGWFHVVVNGHFAFLIGARCAQASLESLENITVYPCQESALHFSHHPSCSLVEMTAELLWFVILQC